MSGLSEHIFVTSVLDKNEVRKALTLSGSLRRVFSSKRLAVITTAALDIDLRRILSAAFDFIFCLEDSPCCFGLSDEEFIKIFLLKALRAFNQGAYLSPSTLVLENIDNIFEQECWGFQFPENATDTSIFLFKPSLPHYESLLKNLPNFDKMNFLQFLKTWTLNQYSSGGYLPTKYSNAITKSDIKLGDGFNVPLINLETYPVESDADGWNQSWFAKYVFGQWISIQNSFVKPSSLKSNTIEPHGCIQPNLHSYSKEPIAIIGLSCRYPGANSFEEFWELLINSGDGTCNLPDFRWHRDQSQRAVPESRSTNAGFLKIQVDEFDGKFFGISPMETLFLDPQHRLLLQIVWEALEDACLDPITLRGTSGSVYVGSWINDYKDILLNSANSDFYRVYMGNSIGACAARLSFMLGMTGPSVATESGCSSSMVAVHMACKSLQLGETNLALACGVNLLLHPFKENDLPLVIAPDGRCKTFSDDANGFARAEGVGVLVLKRLSDAIREGDNILGLIRGSGLSQEGISKSMGTPTVHCESLAMKKALADGNIKPEEVSLIETHGTGTVVGDPMEIAAIAEAYNSPGRHEPLIVGSVKTNIGHTESCSGIAGIMKVLLCFQHDKIPPHINFRKLNPTINLNAVPATIPLEAQHWGKYKGKPRLAGVSSFGITGTDVHVILEEAPKSDMQTDTNLNLYDRPFHLLKLSAKTEEAMEILLNKYMDHMVKNTDNIADICFSANAGRADHSIRIAVTATNKEQMVQAIAEGKYLKRNLEVEARNEEKICFLFTGQGSQYTKMAKSIYETSPVYQIHYHKCRKYLFDKYHLDVSQVILTDDQNEVTRTINSQTAIFCVQYSLIRFWESLGVKPDCVLGHSLGEFAAAVCANVLSVEEAMDLIAQRSILIESLPGGSMLVVKASQNQVNDLLKEYAIVNKNGRLDYAAINAKDQIVLAGGTNTINKFAEFCKEANLKTVLLDAAHAFHSEHMEPILEKYYNAVKNILKSDEIKNRKFSCTYISGMLGKILETEQDIFAPEYWTRHTRLPVQFLKASHAAVKHGCTTFLEIGPQPVLSSLTSMNHDCKLLCLPSLKKGEENWHTLMSSLGALYVNGVKVNWNGLDKYLSRQKVRLPKYPFIGKKYWVDLSGPASNTIHPLLGSEFPNTTSTKLFQTVVSMKNQEWLRDHAIGQHHVFPGAGYVEICISAGFATLYSANDFFQRRCRPAKMQNLRIYSPLFLAESKASHLQTSVQFNSDHDIDGNKAIVKIFQRREQCGSGVWQCHAEACFSPLPSTEDCSAPKCFGNIKDVIANFTEHSDIVARFYEKLDSLGLKFGPAFRSIENLWKNPDEGTAVMKIKSVNLGTIASTEYFAHPVIVDAMLQAIMLFKIAGGLNQRLYVPIKVGKFVWLSSPSKVDPENLYIEVIQEFPVDDSTNSLSTDNCVVVLTTLNDEVIAIMSNVEFTPTTVRAVETVFEQSLNPLPELWEETWKKRVGLTKDRVNLSALSTGFTSHEKNDFIQYNKCPEEVSNLLKSLDRFAYYSILKAFLELGWKPSQPKYNKLEAKKFSSDLKISKEFIKQVSYFFCVLEEEGILTKKTGLGWELNRIPPSLEEIETELGKMFEKHDLSNGVNTKWVITEISKNLGNILAGKQSPLAILFPETKCEGNVSNFYVEYYQLSQFESLSNSIQKCWLKRYKDIEGTNTGIVRILEFGAGTGAFTQEIIRLLEEFNIEFEYTYTDISPAFFGKAEKKFIKWEKQINFKVLNIEEDPLSQGFYPGYYDYICGSDVIHATRDLKESLQHLRLLLKPEGVLDLCEQIYASRFLTFIFGLLDGFWRFKDTELRPDHCTINMAKWEQLLKDTGFEMIGSFPSCNDKHAYIRCKKSPIKQVEIQKYNTGTTISRKTWLMFHEPRDAISEFLTSSMYDLQPLRETILVTKEQLQGAKVKYDEASNLIALNPENDMHFLNLVEILQERRVQVEGITYCWSLSTCNKNQNDILQPLFHLVKSLPTLLTKTRMKLVVIVKETCALDGNDLSGYHSSTICGFLKSLQNENAGLQCKVIDTGSEINNTDKSHIFLEIWNNCKETIVAFKNLDRYVPKLVPLKRPTFNSLELPRGTDRFQVILPKSKAIADIQFGHLDPFVLMSEEIEIEIKATALNFRDLMSVIKPIEKFKDINSVGLDFSGVVKRVGSGVTKWSVGDKVYGANLLQNSSLPSHVKINEHFVCKMSANWNFNEACTLPAVAATSIECLIDIASISSKDTVLIHTASGGVGLCAIQICKHIGATVIATAGSKRKRNYLRNIGIQHVFDSRSTTYLKDIMLVTNGRGVDVVLNSLTSEGFKEATLDACTVGARFVEMSKISVWSSEEISSRRPDIQYTLYDLTLSKPQDILKFLGSLEKLVGQSVLNPLPYTQFAAADIRQALTYMQKAKHIGKIVCTMPEIERVSNGFKFTDALFNDRSTYLITGGLGGIGFEVCKWMLTAGAKYIVLAGRHPPDEKTQDEILRLNNKYSAKIKDVILDAGNFDSVQNLFENQIDIFGCPSINGIMHVAGTLHDGFIENQAWLTFSSTFLAKVQGTLNLHHFAKTNKNLEHFVLFSSCAAYVGTPGQANHAAANYFEDVFAHYRHLQGFPALSINWGQWSEVGVATEAVLAGIKPFSTQQGLAALEYALKSHSLHMGVLNIESVEMMSAIAPTVSSYLDESVIKSTAKSKKNSAALNSKEFWDTYSALQTTDEKTILLKTSIKCILRSVLKLEELDEIEDSLDFQQMGVDSLMFVEIKNQLQNLLTERVAVTANMLKDCNSVNALSICLTKHIEGMGVEMEEEIPSNEQVSNLIMKDILLPQSIRPGEQQVRISIQDVSHVLLTGVTGTLGPYILRELCKINRIHKIYCLIRSQLKVSVETRLQKALKARDLTDEIDMTKVQCISGDLTCPMFGLNESDWKNLSNDVEAVIHCAVKASHLEYYKVYDGNNDTRSVNLKSLKQVFEFACTGHKLKHIFSASSIVTITNVDINGNASEDWPEEHGMDGVTNRAYPITKFVGDILMKKAVTERGIPGKVFRFPIVVGDSNTGSFVLEKNHLMLRYMFILKTGVMPSTPMPTVLLPVDICAWSSINLFFNPDVPDDIYSICNQDPVVDQEFVKVAKLFGYKVDTVELSEFAKVLMNQSEEDTPFAIFADFYKSDEDIISLFSTSSALKQWYLTGSSSRNFFVSSKIKKYLPAFYENLVETPMDHVHKDILYAQKQGWLETRP